MKLDIIIQSGEVNFKNCIENELKQNVKKMYIFSGSIKESGFEIIEENIIDKKIKLVVFMGIDKKNTTKNLLENILNYAAELFVYNNNDLKEFEGTTIIFETDKYASMYISSSKVSENSFIEDVTMISKLSYDLSIDEDKREYKEKVKELLALKEIGFNQLKKSGVQELVDNKVIFSNKQYEHTVKSIAELLGKKEQSKENKKVQSDEDVILPDFDMPQLNLNNDFMDMDIDVSLVEDTVVTNEKVEKDVKKKDKKQKEVEKSDEEESKFDENSLEDSLEEQEEFNSDEILDLDSMLLSRADVKLSEKKKKKESKKEDENVIENSDSELVKVKKLDLNNVTNLIMELPAKQQNKKDLDIIKIPNYIRDLVPAFFEFPENSVTIEEAGIATKQRPLQIEIVDCKNEKKYVENDAKMFQRKAQTFISIYCPSLEKIDYEEKDIVRIIKLSSNIYHIEIVSKEMQEYKIWSKIMNKDMRATDRKFGIM